MHPTLAEIGPLTLHTYGLMVALGYLAAILFAARSASRFGLAKETVLDAAFYVIIFSVIGGRVMYVLVNMPYYLENPVEMVMVHHGGLVYFGGFIVAAVGIYFWLGHRGVNPWDYGDLMVPFVALGHAVGRVGCFLNGCCYGRATQSAWGVVFPALADAQARLPAQLISAAANLALCFFLLYSWRWRRFKGQVVWTYLLSYGLLRFCLEFLRDDDRGRILGSWLTTSQGLSLVGMGLGVYFLIAGKGRKVRRS